MTKLSRYNITAGVDEVGRGCIAGDVYAAAVILPLEHHIIGLKDSKKISELQRKRLTNEIKGAAISYGIAKASVEEISQLNILNATLLAMSRAVSMLQPAPELVLVDGAHIPEWGYQSMAICGGDDWVDSISAASIIAKVARDDEMIKIAEEYPHFGFEKHKGYGTKMHFQALEKHGFCEWHRSTFEPIRSMSLSLKVVKNDTRR